VNFKTAIRKTPHLDHAWEHGLRALRAQDRHHVEPEDSRRLTGSVDVDSALHAHEPNAHRWDFAIGHRHTNRSKECVYWLEIHGASDKEVKVVLAKLHWLKSWLKGSGSLLNQFERDYVWVSSGATSFTLGAPQRKVLAEQGLQHKGRVLRIPNKRPQS
jgi:hypothetical protein